MCPDGRHFGHWVFGYLRGYITIFKTLETSFYPFKSGGAVIGSRLALLGIKVTIGIVAEHDKGLAIPTMDHSPPINGDWLAGVVLEDGAFAPLFGAAERRHK